MFSQKGLLSPYFSHTTDHCPPRRHPLRKTRHSQSVLPPRCNTPTGDWLVFFAVPLCRVPDLFDSTRHLSLLFVCHFSDETHVRQMLPQWFRSSRRSYVSHVLVASYLSHHQVLTFDPNRAPELVRVNVASCLSCSRAVNDSPCCACISLGHDVELDAPDS